MDELSAGGKFPLRGDWAVWSGGGLVIEVDELSAGGKFPLRGDWAVWSGLWRRLSY